MIVWISSGEINKLKDLIVGSRMSVWVFEWFMDGWMSVSVWDGCIVSNRRLEVREEIKEINGMI